MCIRDRDGQKIHAVILPAHAGVGGIFDDANDLIVAGGCVASAERMTDRVAAVEQLLGELLIDDGDGRSAGYVLLANAAARDQVRSNGIKIFGADFDDGGADVGIGLTLYADASSPVVVFHGGIQANADLSHAGDGVEAILDGAIERRQLRGGVARGLRVDVDDITVGGFQVQVGVLELVETLREQAGADQKYERHGGLEDDEAALQQSGACLLYTSRCV